MENHYTSSGKFMTQRFLQQCLQILFLLPYNMKAANKQKENPVWRTASTIFERQDSVSDEAGDAEMPDIQTQQLMTHLRVRLYLVPN